MFQRLLLISGKQIFEMVDERKDDLSVRSNFESYTEVDEARRSSLHIVGNSPTLIVSYNQVTCNSHVYM